MRGLILLLAALLCLGAVPATAQGPAVRAVAVLPTPPLDSDARAVIAAMTVRPGALRQRLISDHVRCRKAAGSWQIDDIYAVFLAHDEQAARINWKTPGVNTAVNTNSVAFTVDRGFTTDGATNFIDLVMSPATATQAKAGTPVNARIDVWEGVNTGAANYAIGAYNFTSQSLLLRPRATGTAGAAAINNSAASVGSVATSVGLTAIQREADDSLSFWKNGVLNGTSATVQTGSGFPTNSIYVGGYHSNSGLTNPRASTYDFASFGARYPSGVAAADFACRDAYRAALGAQ